jgi:hypothetical protein
MSDKKYFNYEQVLAVHDYTDISAAKVCVTMQFTHRNLMFAI